MLAHPNLSRREVVRPAQSLRQEYEEFRQQRIEDYKNRLSRQELMELADRAMQSIRDRPANQLSLTEVLVSEQVDRIIVEALKIPRFSRWKSWFVKVRLAQRQVTHWQRMAPDCALADQVLYLEPDDTALVIGARCADHAYYIAAHDCDVTFIAEDVFSVDAIEGRAASEALSGRFDAYAVDLASGWFPECHPALVVVDPGALIRLDEEGRRIFVERIKSATPIGGKHYYPSIGGEDGMSEIRSFSEFYGNWLLAGGGEIAVPALLTRPA